MPAPGLSVEGADIVPDREPGQQAIALSLGKQSLAEGINFDSADGAVSEQKIREETSSAASEQMKCSKSVGVQLIEPPFSSSRFWHS